MWTSFKSWLDSPFNAGMSAYKWFAFIGLLLVLLALWGVVIGHMREL